MSNLQPASPLMTSATTVPAAATARFTNTDASAAMVTAASLAATTRGRIGTNAKVVRAVRCDHSLVTERMPSTGSSTPGGSSERPNSWSNHRSPGPASTSCAVTNVTADRPMMISSQ